MKKAGYNRLWGIYWRSLVAMIASFSLVSYAHHALGILNVITEEGYLPALFWFLVGLLFYTPSMFFSKGLTYLLLGSRLTVPPHTWQKLNMGMTCFFIALALLSILMFHLLNTTTWAYYKLYAQPFLLLVSPALCAKFALRSTVD